MESDYPEGAGFSHEQWTAIYEVIEKYMTKMEFTQDVVTQRNVTKGIIFTQQFGSTPIPIVGFDLQVKYYDSVTSGNTPAVGAPLPKVVAKKLTKATDVTIQIPKIGDIVLIALIGGSRRLPRCLGKIQSRNFEGD